MAPGSLVRCEARGWIGVVQPCDPRCARDQFPVRWLNGLWEIMTAEYVSLVSAPAVPDEREAVTIPRHE